MKDFMYAFVILVLLAFLSYEKFFDKGRIVEVQKRDTILVRDTIRLEKIQGKIVYKIKEKRDTVVVYDSSAFVTCFDTAYNRSYFSVCYAYPENHFSTFISFVPDTVQKHIIIEKPIIKLEPKQEPWYYDVIKVSGGIVLGFLFGRAR